MAIYVDFGILSEELLIWKNIFENDINSIKNFLRDNKIGNIDIIYKCYRLNDNSSLDSDLSIIELEDIPALLERFPKITNIYATSCFVRDLLISKQIRPLISNHIINNNGTHEQFTLFKRNINLYRLKSPSIRAGYNDDELINNYHILLENNLQ